MKNKPSLARSDFKPAPVANTPNSGARFPARTATREEISARARVLWEQRGRPFGLDDEIWLQAERQLGVSPARSGELRDSEEDIEDANKLEERLDEIGEPTERRSPTSL